jgi:hypothetical protein
MVEFITYKGKKYPIRVSYYVLLMASKEQGVSLEDIDNNLEMQQSVLWYALVAGHKISNKELTLNREDIIWILDECYIEFQKALFTFGKAIIDMQQEVTKDTNGKKK